MAELGSHQLDASSIFISAMRDDGKKAHAADASRPSAAGTCSRRTATRRPRLLHVRVPRPGYDNDRTQDPARQEDRRHLLVDQRQRLRRLRRSRDGHQGHADPGARAGSDALQQGAATRRPRSASQGKERRPDARHARKAAAARRPPSARRPWKPARSAAATPKRSSTGPGASATPTPSTTSPSAIRRWPWATPSSP